MEKRVIWIQNRNYGLRRITTRRDQLVQRVGFRDRPLEFQLRNSHGHSLESRIKKKADEKCSKLRANSRKLYFSAIFLTLERCKLRLRKIWSFLSILNWFLERGSLFEDRSTFIKPQHINGIARLFESWKLFRYCCFFFLERNCDFDTVFYIIKC